MSGEGQKEVQQKSMEESFKTRAVPCYREDKELENSLGLEDLVFCNFK